MSDIVIIIVGGNVRVGAHVQGRFEERDRARLTLRGSNLVKDALLNYLDANVESEKCRGKGLS